MHPAEREPGLITGIEAATPQAPPVPTEFVERPGHHGQRTELTDQPEGM
jgi:hypothetical protein